MRPLFPPQSSRACTHWELDDHRLYAFIRDSRLPRSTFAGPWYVSPDGFLWGATAVLALALIAVVIIVI